jgi:hypothetical protein
LLQVPVWEATVNREIRNVDFDKSLASNPALRQEASSMMAQSFARPLPEDFDFLEKTYVDEADGIQKLLFDLKDQYTRVIGSSGECMCVGVRVWMVDWCFRGQLSC